MKKKAGIIAASVASIVMCSSVIAGSTFALFTSESSVDVVVKSAKVNVTAKVVGNVVTDYDETLSGANSAFTAEVEGNKLTLNNMAPGDSAEFKIEIRNYSSISVLYNTELSGDNSLLFDALDISIDGSATYKTLYSPVAAATDTKAGDLVKTVTVKVSLPVDYKSVYSGENDSVQGVSTNLTFKVNAIQGNAVVNQEVSSVEDLNKALEVGGVITLTQDIDGVAKKYAVVNGKDAVINLNGHNLNSDIKVVSANTLIINGDNNSKVGAKYGESSQGQNIFAAAEGSKIIINGGHYVTYMTAAYAHTGDIEINDGIFEMDRNFYKDIDMAWAELQANKNGEKTLDEVTAYLTENLEESLWKKSLIDQIKLSIEQPTSKYRLLGDGAYYAKFLLNCLDDNYKNGSSNVTVTGGKFNYMDPQNSDSENPRANFVADGYRVVESEEDGMKWYTVCENGKIATNEELATAITACADGDTLNLGAGTFTLPTANNVMVNKTVKIVGAGKGKTIIDRTAATGQATGGMELIVENATIQCPNENYKGYQHDESETYINCEIKGHMYLYATTAKFKNCVFEQLDRDWYNVQVYGTSAATFEHCVFNTSRKAVHVYNEGTTHEITVNLIDCEFNCKSEALSDKAALEIHQQFLNEGYKYTVNITNCKQNNFYSMFAVKDPGKGKAAVTIDGVLQTENV